MDKQSRIRILPRNLINQIAAGEVIVRPASVAKELVENAIDAGAKQISLEVSPDVRDLSVTDDGCGMTPGEAPLSLLRHATSKVSSLEDIVNVQTRGFRGEALASIAAVSRLILTTRTPERDAATRVTVEGGELVKTESTGAPTGTSVAIRQLFFNTPARLKFMRRPATELKRLLQVVTQQALSHPDIGFTLVGKKKLLELPMGQSLKDRLRQVLGSSVEDQLLPLDSGNLPVTIHGFIAKPEAGRRDRSGQYFFVNRRPISNRILTVTFEQAYRGLMMSGRYPVGAVFVFLDPEEVDVNVHPTKEEVRFRDERKVGGILNRVVSESLRKANLVPYTRLPEAGEERGAGTGSPGTQKQTMPGFFSSPGAAMRESFKQKSRVPSRQEETGLFREWPGHPISGEKHPPSSSRLPRPLEEIPTVPTPSPVPETADEFRASLEKAEPLGQIANTFIVASCGDALLLIDQHAAHERIVYEKIRDRKSELVIQNLLLPIEFEVEVSRVPDMEELSKRLSEFGLEVERFGGQSFVVRSVPADLAETDPTELIKEILESPDVDLKNLGESEVRNEIIRRMACHGAIRAGQRLSREEMTALILELKNTRLAFTCPHGRPTMILMTKSQLDRQFKRVL